MLYIQCACASLLCMRLRNGEYVQFTHVVVYMLPSRLSFCLRAIETQQNARHGCILIHNAYNAIVFSLIPFHFSHTRALHTAHIQLA